MKNVAVIVNNAIFAKFFILLAIELKNKGYNVTIVCDSKYTYDKFNISRLENIHTVIFTDYFINKYKNNELVNNNVLQDQWLSHADYDRMRYVGFNFSRKHLFLNDYNSALISFYNELYETKSYSAIIYENVSNALAYAAYEVGKLKGVKYLGLTASRLPGHALFSSMDDLLADEIQMLGEMFYKNITDEEHKYIKQYIENIITTVPDYMKTNGLSKPSFFKKLFSKRDVSTIVSALVHTFKSSARFDIQNGKPLVRSMMAHRRNLFRLVRSRWIKKYYTNEYANKKYIVYPLHYHPESSTSILACQYDEFNLIKNIAFSLPPGYCLLVKDHISAYGFNSVSFYRDISSLPGVYLAAPEKNAKELVSKSLGVITLTSTVGYEAAILGKPVAVFGKVFYEKHKQVLKLASYNQINHGISYIINYQDKAKDNISLDNEMFLFGYYRKCFPFKMNYNSPIKKLEVDAKYIAGMVDRELANE